MKDQSAEKFNKGVKQASMFIIAANVFGAVLAAVAYIYFGHALYLVAAALLLLAAGIFQIFAKKMLNQYKALIEKERKISNERKLDNTSD